MTADLFATELVTLVGADALSYLDSQCTQQLANLEVGALAETLVLQPNGDIVGVGVARRTSEDVVTLEVPMATGAAVLARLERFAIRAAVSFAGPAPGVASPPMPADELQRIREGFPGAAEITRTLVAHALSEQLRTRTVSFTKGCYPGQELVARMESRHATPPYVLLQCTLDGPGRPGDQVGDPAKEGVLTSVAHDDDSGSWVALCVVHRRDAASKEAEVRSEHAHVARFE